MKKTALQDPSECTLQELCDQITEGGRSLGDIFEYVQDAAYAECDKQSAHKAVKRLQSVALFIERVENKTDEICRDVGQIYALIGEVFQHVGEFAKSVQWLEKAIIVDDQYDVTYHSLANSYIHMGNSKQAVKCLTQEIRVAPGNYFAYHVLADIYDQLGESEKFEQTLEKLLERDQNNIRALHKLICHYEKQNPEVQVELLRRRLINTKANLSKRELIIWTYHMCAEDESSQALAYLTKRLDERPDMRIIFLLRAFIYGKMHQYRKRTNELALFAEQSKSRNDLMAVNLADFESIFGEEAARSLSEKLGFKE
jgi:tetratricopeptide (TPR) repeat protein